MLCVFLSIFKIIIAYYFYCFHAVNRFTLINSKSSIAPTRLETSIRLIQRALEQQVK